MAKALGVKAISTSTQVSVAKRVAPFADKHQLTVAYHNHSNVTDPDEVATPESFAAVTSHSKFHGINLDVGHFTAANFDAARVHRGQPRAHHQPAFEGHEAQPGAVHAMGGG